MDKKESVATLLNAKFSHNTTALFKGESIHGGIDIHWTRNIDASKEQLQQLIIEAIQWAEEELNTDVNLNGSTPIYDIAGKYILVAISI